MCWLAVSAGAHDGAHTVAAPMTLRGHAPTPRPDGRHPAVLGPLDGALAETGSTRRSASDRGPELINMVDRLGRPRGAPGGAAGGAADVGFQNRILAWVASLHRGELIRAELGDTGGTALSAWRTQTPSSALRPLPRNSSTYSKHLGKASDLKQEVMHYDRLPDICLLELCHC